LRNVKKKHWTGIRPFCCNFSLKLKLKLCSFKVSD